MKKWPFYLAFLLFLMVGLALWLRPSSHTPLASAGNDGLPAGPFVARVYYNQISDIDQLVDYDVWEYNNLQEKYVLVSMNKAIYHRLAGQGWRLEVDDEATGQLYNNLDTFYGGYHTVEENYAELTAITTDHPDITELVDYGNSYCKHQLGCLTLGGEVQPGYDLMAIRITNEAITGTKPIFFLMSAIHSREITTPELTMRMAKWLVDGYGVNADATWLVDNHEIWIVPHVNPDGHWIVVLGTLPPYNGSPFWQRKNANRSVACNQWPPTSFSQYGVDLNRNHSFMWGGGGSSPDPCAQTYRGTAAASEYETTYLQNLILTLIPDQRGPGINDPAPDNTTGIFITVHSAAGLVLWPWGFTASPAPNMVGLQDIGDKFATYNGYTSCQPPLCLYAVNGSSDDWVYGELGAPSFTFEVGFDFMPPYSEVDAIQWPDNGPAFQYAAKIARTPYQSVRGPDALSLNVITTTNTVTLTATLDDSDNGNQTINAAVYQLDTPYWSSGAISETLTASDGNFNSQVEGVTAVIDTAGLTPGRHTLFVRGKDSQNNWGPVSAIFLEVEQPLEPTAAFTSTSPDALGTETAFTNTSTGLNLTYEWDFGDGSPTVTDANPTHTYAYTGVYTVTLTATNDLGSDSTTGLVEIMLAPQAAFTSTSPDELGEQTTFTNTSTGDDLTFEWDFGDGSGTSSDTNPVHTYTAAGAYTVTLTATNAVGSSTITATVEITPTPITYTLYLPIALRD
jgi:PKD repeat protein